MKAAPWIVAGLALIVGFLLGGVGPRRDAGKLNSRIAELEEDLYSAKRSGRTARYMPMPGLDNLPSRPRANTPRPTDTATPVADADETAEESPVETEFELSPEDMEMFDTAVDAQRVRAAQSRAALQEQADLNDEQMQEVDDIVADMNDALAEYADEILDMIESGGDPDARDVLGLSHEVTGILYDSQVALEDSIGDGMSGVDDDAGVVWNYVDLEIFREAAESATSQ